MEYLIGWALLGGVIFILWAVIRFAGGERDQPDASCGVDGCGRAIGRDPR